MDSIMEQIVNGSVPVASIVFMALSLMLAIILPISLFLYFKKKYNCSIRPFIIGCGVWLVFASILERLAHGLILGSGVGAAIQNNTILYCVYGGLMAALFEEGGRLLAYKFVLKKEITNNYNSLMYGAGHGGVEALYILGIGMFSNIMISFMINNGTIGLTLETLKTVDENTAMASMENILTLITAPSWMFIVGIIERVAAVAGHIAMSVMVWYAFKHKKPLYFAAAFAFHFIMDALSGFLSVNGVNTIIIEVVVYAIVAFEIFAAYIIHKKNKDLLYTEVLS